MKVLVIRFSSIGDIVLTTPVLRCLKAQLGAEVHYLTKSSFAGVVGSNPYIDKLWTLEGDFQNLVAQLKEARFDRVIDLHKNIRSHRLRMQLGVRSHSFNKLNFQKWLMVRFKWDTLPSKHIVDRYFEAISSLGVHNDGKGLDFFIHKKDQQYADHSEVVQTGAPFVALVLGAAHYTKQIPEEILRKFLVQLNYPVALIGGPGEKALGSKLSGENIFNYAGKTSLGESAAILQKSAIIISPDTGMMHVAAALQKPLISVWGNTIPAFGMFPYFGDEKTYHYSSQVGGLKCRPCSKIGYQTCPQGHFKCMRLQPWELWVSKINNFLRITSLK
jgi:ADP-heptose:LPS heptosyltransferase